MFDGDTGRLIWFILAFTLGAVWLVCVCIIVVFAIIRMINTAKNRVESARFQRIFRFLLRAILPFFFVLFLAGGCSTIFVSPKVHYCIIRDMLFGMRYCEYTIYGIFITGNEGSVIDIKFKRTK